MNEATVIAPSGAVQSKLNGSALEAPLTISSTSRFQSMMDSYLIQSTHIHLTTIPITCKIPKGRPIGPLGPPWVPANAAISTSCQRRRRWRSGRCSCCWIRRCPGDPLRTAVGTLIWEFSFCCFLLSGKLSLERMGHKKGCKSRRYVKTPLFDIP